MKNIVIIEKVSGKFTPASHVMTQLYDNPESLSEALMVWNSLEQYRYDKSTKSKSGKVLSAPSKREMVRLVYKDHGEIGLNWLTCALEIEQGLKDRFISLAISHAICQRQNLVFEKKDLSLIRAEPYIKLHQEAVVISSESTMRRFLQNSKLYLQYADMPIIDANEMCERSDRVFILNALRKAGIDFGRIAKEQISQWLAANHNIHMTGSNLRFLNEYL